MANFLTTLGISSRIEEIINYSKKELFLISPYFQISDVFYSRLDEASNRGVEITIIFGKKKLIDSEFQSLLGIPSMDLLYCHNLHAKCYFNELNMVVTSMNMYAFSERNNREMGIYIQSDKDKDLYNQAKQEALSIANASELVVSNRSTKDYSNQGYCIRCGIDIQLNPKAPLCRSCYTSWNEFQNHDYAENFCHVCGRNGVSSFAKPICYSCF